MRQVRKQRGVALVTIVILLVVFVTVGFFMATRSNVQHLSVALSARTMQAWFAAQAGMEWAVHQATVSQVAHDAICGNPATVTAFAIPAGASAGYNLNITCADSGGFTEAGVGFEVDLITVVATDGTAGDSTFVSRTLQAVVTTGIGLP